MARHRSHVESVRMTCNNCANGFYTRLIHEFDDCILLQSPVQTHGVQNGQPQSSSLVYLDNNVLLKLMLLLHLYKVKGAPLAFWVATSALLLCMPEPLSWNSLRRMPSRVPSTASHYIGTNCFTVLLFFLCKPRLTLYADKAWTVRPCAVPHTYLCWF